MTPREFLKLPIDHEDVVTIGGFTQLYREFGLNGCHYEHVPELAERTVKGAANTRVKVRWARWRQSDTRRFWAIGSVWIDDRPVMIVRNAGREGDDSAARYVLDWDAYDEMVRYLQSVSDMPAIRTEKNIPLDEDILNLTSFYGGTLEGDE